MPNLLGRSPEFITNRNGSAERFRTSGGIAESRESLLRQSHSVWIARVTRFRQTPKSEPNSNFPLLVFLHGAGQSADEMFDYLGTAPEEATRGAGVSIKPGVERSGTPGTRR